MDLGIALEKGEERLIALAGRAQYRIEPASVEGLWLLIDGDGELMRTPTGERVWSPADAERHLRAVAPLAPS